MNVKATGKVNSFLTFRIGNEIYAANVKNVLNILEMTKITKVPKSPSYMLGVINLRGIVLPVIDSRIKLGIEILEVSSNTCIIVLELHLGSEPIMVGAIVDSVKEVMEISDTEILAPPSLGTNFRSDYLLGMAQSADGFIMLLNTEKVFASEEIVDLANIAEAANKKIVAESE